MSARVDFSRGGIECRFCARVWAGARNVSAEVVGECCGYEWASGCGDWGRACGSADPEVRLGLLSRSEAELLEFCAVSRGVGGVAAKFRE